MITHQIDHVDDPSLGFGVWNLRGAFIHDATSTSNEQYEANQNHHAPTFCPQVIFDFKE
jgi:hypothetical protein